MLNIAPKKISSPCINVCVIDQASSICTGCGRTTAEIGGWLGYTEAERLATMTTLADRLLAAGLNIQETH
jgi:uncharacterized protein